MDMYVPSGQEERAMVPRVDFTEDVVGIRTLIGLMNDRISGRTRSELTTRFMNIGPIGLQFGAFAGAVYEPASGTGLGWATPTELFLEKTRA